MEPYRHPNGQEEFDANWCKGCGWTYGDVWDDKCYDCGEKEDLAVNRAQQRQINRWNED